MKKIVILFARKDSIYKKFIECDVYDKDRDALTFDADNVIIAHPPCRLWGRLRHFSKAPDNEKNLALWVIDMIRKNGGILEHPANSKLWSEKNLPPINKYDRYGGFIISYPQFYWGHKANKNTKFYICGIKLTDLPEIPFKMGEPDFVIALSKRNNKRKKEVTKKEREATPEKLAIWLIDTAKIINERKLNVQT